MYSFEFLEAAVPLTKTFRKTESGYDVQPYPMIKNFTSHRRDATDLEQLLTILVQHASLGHCLLKGLVRERLVKQPRAGYTNAAAETNWLLLDLDFDEGWDTVADFLDELDPAFRDVSFIFQHSSSAGIKGKAGLRGHVWILLDQPILPTILKEWLRARNLQLGKLADKLQLTVNGHSLRWPLDTTTCQNDKLIYIAPPVCEGLDDPLKEKRFELVKRGKDKAGPLKLDLSPAVLTAQQKAMIDALRKKANLPASKAKYKTVDGVEVLTNPDEAIVTGVKHGRGFVYLNLNGGDSWAYYFPESKPELLHNFKGEPSVRLRDVAPAFYDQFVAQLRAENEKVEREKRWEEKRPFVFRDRVRDAYYNALYYPKEDRVELAKTNSLLRLQHFCLQYGETPPDVIEDWEVEFNPTSLKIVDFDTRWVNTFDPSPYLRKSFEPVRTLPPVIAKILDSICVEDTGVKNHFLNWLAYIYQTRRKTMTSWVFHGVSGTGKGVLVSKILKPLFGAEHVLEVTIADMEDRFNSNFERALILWIDEFQAADSREADKVMNRLKNIITEERISLRGMRQEAVQTRSFTNVIVATNHNDPVRLTRHDRRFNVAPPQEKKLEITQAELAAIDDELVAFAAFLQHYEVSVPSVRQVLLNDARDNMIYAGQTTIDRFFQAARAGDLSYFLQFLEARMPLQDTVFYSEYESLVSEWCRAALAGAWYPVARSDLQKLYTYIIGNGLSPAKFGRVCAINRLQDGRVESNGRHVHGYRIKWAAPQEEIERFLEARTMQQKPKLVANQ